MSSNARLTCRLCGQEHIPVELAAGESALCVRCDGVLLRSRRTGPDPAFIFSLTGLALAVPTLLTPFISAGRSGGERVSFLFTGVTSLWERGMEMLAVLVLFCGGLLPLTLLVILAILHAPARWGWRWIDVQRLREVAHVLGHWAIPEVHVLAVLVALIKLRSAVDLTIGPGFWFYCGAALSLLIAQRSSEGNRATAPAGSGEFAPATSP